MPTSRAVDPNGAFAASRQSLLEETLNYLTHGFGLLLSAGGMAVLVVFASIHGNAWHIVGCSIYGATLVILYAASTLYHASRSPRYRRAFQTVDHVCIFLLIAGTYTPFTLVSLGGGWGWSLFGVVWGLALLGIILKVFLVRRFKLISTLAYLGLGWLGIIAIVPLHRNLPPGGLVWLAAGGAAYSIGTIFFAWKRIPFSHTVWHLFVLTGSICHYFAVMFYVLPLS